MVKWRQIRGVGKLTVVVKSLYNDAGLVRRSNTPRLHKIVHLYSYSETNLIWPMAGATSLALPCRSGAWVCQCHV